MINYFTQELKLFDIIKLNIKIAEYNDSNFYINIRDFDNKYELLDNKYGVKFSYRMSGCKSDYISYLKRYVQEFKDQFGINIKFFTEKNWMYLGIMSDVDLQKWKFYIS